MSKFAERLKELRLENNLGQIELAEKLGVSKGAISLWENDIHEPLLSYIVKIAQFFDVSSDYLIGLEDFR